MFVGPWFKMWFKGVELSKEGIIVPGSVLDHTRFAIERTTMSSSAPALEPKSHDRAHAICTHVFRVSLAAITKLLVSWDFQSNYVLSSALPVI
jgi:hypothetical protein